MNKRENDYCKDKVPVEIRRGEWANLKIVVTVNHLGKEDGIVEFYLRDYAKGSDKLELVGKFTHLFFRKEVPKLKDLLPKKLLFDTCMGGQDNSYVSPQTNYIAFDNMAFDQEVSIERSNFSVVPSTLASFKVYPNPAVRNTPVYVAFEVTTSTEIILDITNTLGQTVYKESGSYPEGRHEILLDHPQDDHMLFLTIRAGKEVLSQKLILR
jgi:hypothetical protein